ncbi:hypothetical protein ES332_D10G227200v1 [Gossypium tomentosum]|uniref:Uncharacterized protein n=1 Tax=Gossypium tomentosum TaxID=34277 RepID=A0A5D2J9N7_GOSTO|nr:hypothetical protein ES332_D10G227200v1 [Gossypium tomentosum]
MEPMKNNNHFSYCHQMNQIMYLKTRPHYKSLIVSNNKNSQLSIFDDRQPRIHVNF